MYWKSLYGNKIGLIFSDGEKASKQNLFKYLNHIPDQKGWFVELLMPLRKSSQQNVTTAIKKSHLRSYRVNTEDIDDRWLPTK
jgi:hypothetical protein